MLRVSLHASTRLDVFTLLVLIMGRVHKRFADSRCWYELKPFGDDMGPKATGMVHKIVGPTGFVIESKVKAPNETDALALETFIRNERAPSCSPTESTCNFSRKTIDFYQT